MNYCRPQRAVLYTNHPYTKQNPCNGKQSTVVTNYSLQYWELYIDNCYSGQPSGAFAWGCLASDTRRGCKTS